MKTILSILLSLTFFILCAGAVHANGPKTQSIDKLLKKEISYPDPARKQKLEGMVLVSFTINANGTVTINMTNESSAVFKDYVVNKLKKLRIKPSKENTGITYNVKFVFKIEK